MDTDVFQPRTSQGAFLGIPTDALLFLFVGDIKTSRKNLDTVLRAIRRLPGVHLAVAGAVRGSAYPQMAREFGITGRVHFLGKAENMPALLNGVRGFVFPSRYEAMALVLLEAMASGVPIITSSTAGASDLNIDPAYILSDPDDVDGLTQMIRRLAENERLSAEIGRRNRETALLHTWETMTEQYLELFSEITHAKRSASQI